MSNVPNRSQNLLSADGAIPDGDGLFHITKASAAALTQAAPTVDGQRKTFIDETGQAHVIAVAPTGSPATAGLNGASVTHITFNGTKGSMVELIGRNGNWWTGARSGVTLS